MFLTDDLLNSIKKRGIIPADDNTINDTDMLNFADEELISYIAPLLMAFNEEYFVNYIDFDITDASGGKFEIPYRAMGANIREVHILDSTGVPVSIAMIKVSELTNNQRYTMSQKFYIQDNKVVLYPFPNQYVGNKLRIYFFMRPNKMVLTNQCGRITNINTNTGEVEVNNLPSGFILNTQYDIVKGKPGFSTLAFDISPTGLTGTTFTFSSLPQGLAIGDYICLAQTTCVPQIPAEVHPMLAQSAVVRILDSLTHTEALKNAIGKLEKMEKGLVKLLGVRVKSKAVSIRNPENPLNYSRR